MIQDIIVAIILLAVVVWLFLRVRRSLFQKGQNPCESCATPCKLKGEIARKDKQKQEKCHFEEENRRKN